ncbi:VOC family protein [Leeuwenhoekiella sp. H156]|uniref:VOC family protein n=1 Tax=Leeuwenhoekiella sp. H156 TaxID=3450128 RepID=UPI003FA4B236
MKIRRLKIYTARPAEQRQFYEETLGLQVSEKDAKSFSVKLGKSILTLEERQTATPYHFAITIPAGKEQEALSWLKQRVEVLRNGEKGIQYFENWDARAIYFYDADHNIVEFIARNTLNNQTSDAFSKAQLLEISEIGLPTDAIEQRFITLNKTLGLEVYDGSFERFCAVGDANGLIILIDKNSRKWFPTNDTAYPSDFELDTVVEGVEFRIIFRNELLKIEHL